MKTQAYQIITQIFGQSTRLPTIYTNFDEAIVACMEANDAFTRIHGINTPAIARHAAASFGVLPGGGSDVRLYRGINHGWIHHSCRLFDSVKPG